VLVEQMILLIQTNIEQKRYVGVLPDTEWPKHFACWSTKSDYKQNV